MTEGKDDPRRTVAADSLVCDFHHSDCSVASYHTFSVQDAPEMEGPAAGHLASNPHLTHCVAEICFSCWPHATHKRFPSCPPRARDFPGVATDGDLPIRGSSLDLVHLHREGSP